MSMHMLNQQRDPPFTAAHVTLSENRVPQSLMVGYDVPVNWPLISGTYTKHFL